jgi:D-beta-D-heptose 7-phosphate kinase/D-beta-D-heptose 1-phosphate adenosyltransferase
MNDIVLVSGGFDPVHSGHIALIQEAARFGEVVVLLNSDRWLRKKKEKEFLPFKERKTIIGSIKKVIDVLSFNDSDLTCINGIQKAIKKYPKHNLKFANGGDRKGKTMLENKEAKFCQKNGVETLWGIGGDFKMNSSSWILKRWKE